MYHLFIINPKSGKGNAVQYSKIITNYFHNLSDKYEIIQTEYPNHATEILLNYNFKEPTTIYSIGGDGTLNEVLNGIHNKDINLAVIPAGSGNDFIKTLSSYNKTSHAEHLLNAINGNVRIIDLAKVNDKYFLNIASIGFDAHVAKNAKYFKNNSFLSGSISYILGAILTLFKFKYSHIEYTIDDKIHISAPFLIAAANGKYYGGGKKLAFDASINDGFLDIYIVDKINFFYKIIYLICLLMNIDIRKLKYTTHLKAKKLNIHSNKNILCNIDGELIWSKIFNFYILENNLRIIQPKK